MTVRIIIDLCIAAGLFFALAGVIGVLKMPDVFCRMQVSTCITTLGVLGVIVGGVLYAACVMHSGAAAVKLAIIGVLIICVNPIGAHAIAKGAYRSGLYPGKMEMDDFRRDFHE